MVNDIKQDLDDHNKYFKSSENTRVQMQNSMDSTSKKIMVDTDAHDKEHKYKIDEIKNL